MGAIDAEAQMIRRFVDMMKLLDVYLNHFPKREKYALSMRIRNTAYEVYDLIIEGQKRYHKKTSLTQLDIAHERLRMQLYLAHEMDYFSFKAGKKSAGGGARRYLAINRRIDEIGRMIGGWISNQRVSS